MIKFILLCVTAYFLLRPAFNVYMENKVQKEQELIDFMFNRSKILDPIKTYENCLDADKDNCAKDDPNCMWRTHTCHFCGKDYKISKRALTGKYMIADHHKVCKELK